jgi:hypothetical protein
LALFSRRSSQPVVRLLRPAAENLHNHGHAATARARPFVLIATLQLV